MAAGWVLFAAHQGDSETLGLFLDSGDTCRKRVGLRDAVVEDVTLFVIEGTAIGAPPQLGAQELVSVPGGTKSFLEVLSIEVCRELGARMRSDICNKIDLMGRGGGPEVG